MSLNVNEVAFEFMKMKEKFEELGFELIGSKDHNEEKIFLVKEKSKE